MKCVYRNSVLCEYGVSIRRYPRSSVWMIQAESCVEMRVCALCGGQRGGSGSQLVVGFTT